MTLCTTSSVQSKALSISEVSMQSGCAEVSGVELAVALVSLTTESSRRVLFTFSSDFLKKDSKSIC